MNIRFNTKTYFTYTAVLFFISFFLMWIHPWTVNSDVLIEEIWARLLSQKGISHWNQLVFTFSPAFYPDFFGHILGKSIGLSTLNTIFFATFFQIANLVLSVYLTLKILNKATLKSLSHIIYIVSLFSFNYVLYPIWLWYFTANDNLSATILGIYALVLNLMFLSSPSFIWGIFIMVLTGFGLTNGRLFALTYLAPSLCTQLVILLYLYTKRGSNAQLKKYGSLLIYNLLGLLLALKFFDPILTPHSTAGKKQFFKMDLWVSLKSFYQAITSILFTKNGHTMIFSWIIVGTVILGVIHLLKILKLNISIGPKEFAKNEKKLNFVLFAFFGILGNISGPIVAGQITFAPGTLRYLSTTVTLSLMMMIYLGIEKFYFLHRTLLRKRFHTFFVVYGLVLLVTCVYQIWGHSWHLKMNNIIPTLEWEAARCVDKYAKDYTFKKGVSDFWNSYAVSIFSKTQVIINPICNNLEPCSEVNLFNFQSGRSILDDLDNPQYNFVIVSGDKQFNFTSEKLLLRIPPPDRILPCEYGYLIYFYTQSEKDLNRILGYKFDKMEFGYGFKGEIALSPKYWLPDTSVKLENSSLSLANNVIKGTLLGYNQPLKPGDYQLSFDLDPRLTNLSGNHFLFLGLSDNENLLDPISKIIKIKPLKDVGKNKISFKIYDSQSTIPFRIWVDKEVGVKSLLQSIQLKRIN